MPPARWRESSHSASSGASNQGSIVKGKAATSEHSPMAPPMALPPPLAPASCPTSSPSAAAFTACSVVAAPPPPASGLALSLRNFLTSFTSCVCVSAGASRVKAKPTRSATSTDGSEMAWSSGEEE